MKITMGYSMGYSGTSTEWEEEIPDDVVEGGEEAIQVFIEETHDYLFQQACEKISVWANVKE